MASAKTISRIPETQATLPFGELLVSKGLLTREELEKVLDEQRKQGGRLGEILLRLEKLNHEDVTLALAEHLSMEYIRLDDSSKMNKVDMDIARMLPESIAKRFCLVAISEVDDKVVVVMADPLNVVALDTVALKIKSGVDGFFMAGLSHTMADPGLIGTSQFEVFIVGPEAHIHILPIHKIGFIGTRQCLKILPVNP